MITKEEREELEAWLKANGGNTDPKIKPTSPPPSPPSGDGGEGGASALPPGNGLLRPPCPSFDSAEAEISWLKVQLARTWGLLDFQTDRIRLNGDVGDGFRELYRLHKDACDRAQARVTDLEMALAKVCARPACWVTRNQALMVLGFSGQRGPNGRDGLKNPNADVKPAYPNGRWSSTQGKHD